MIFVRKPLSIFGIMLWRTSKRRKMQRYSGFCKATSASYSGRQKSSSTHRRGWFSCQCKAFLARAPQAPLPRAIEELQIGGTKPDSTIAKRI